MQPSNTLKSDFFDLFTSSTVYLALYTTAPNAADSAGTEVTGGGYSRQAISWAAPNIGTGTLTSSAGISFTNMPTATITHYGIRTASSGGDLLAFGTIASIASLSGDEVVVAAGNITITFAGA